MYSLTVFPLHVAMFKIVIAMSCNLFSEMSSNYSILIIFGLLFLEFCVYVSYKPTQTLMFSSFFCFNCCRFWSPQIVSFERVYLCLRQQMSCNRELDFFPVSFPTNLKSRAGNRVPVVPCFFSMYRNVGLVFICLFFVYSIFK